MVVSGVEQASEEEGLDHGAHGDLADEHAVSVADLDDVEGDQGAYGLAHGGAGHAQVGAQLRLGRQGITRLKAGSQDEVLDRGHRGLGLSGGGRDQCGVRAMGDRRLTRIECDAHLVSWWNVGCARLGFCAHGAALLDVGHGSCPVNHCAHCDVTLLVERLHPLGGR